MVAILEMVGITKRYGALTANDHVDFTLMPGEVHAVVGENGAGKTTLMKMLYGMESPTSGMIRIRGKEVRFASPADAIRQGIGMVHQHFMMFSSFTVAENIVAGHEPRRWGIAFDRKSAVKRVRELSKRYQLPVDAERRMEECSVGMQQRAEILKVLYQGADIIILDEPSAVLTPLEVKELLSGIRGLADQGKSIIIITHKLHEVMEAADRITVLRAGKVTGVLNKRETNVEELSRRMVGRELADFTRSERQAGQPVVTVRNMTVRTGDGRALVDNVSFQVCAGEIVGIAGVSGNGQSELIQAMSGLRAVHEGTVTLLGVDVTKADVGTIRSSGLAHVPEDRYLWGSAKEATVEETAVMGHLDLQQLHRGGWLRRRDIRGLVGGWVEKYGVKTPTLSTKAQHLSGGNLQKLIIAREMAHESPLLIAAEPTRGVDIGAMEFIHNQLLKKRDNGGAVLLVSSELSEVIKLSDRILIIFEGRIAGELSAAEADEERIGLLMAGGKAPQ